MCPLVLTKNPVPSCCVVLFASGLDVELTGDCTTGFATAIEKSPALERPLAFTLATQFAIVDASRSVAVRANSTAPKPLASTAINRDLRNCVSALIGKSAASSTDDTALPNK